MKGLFRRIVAVTAVFALIFCAMAISPSAASADISIRIDATSYSQDDQITAEVYFPRAYKKISSLDMSLLYDSQKLEFVSMKQGKDLRRARDKQTNGEVYSEYAGDPGKINWSLAGGNNYEFSGIFSTIVFKVKSYANHGSSKLSLKINNAVNSGFVNMTNDVNVSGASFTILRNSMNDIDCKLNKAGTGYIITDYTCATYDTVILSDTYKGLPIVGIDYAAFLNHAEIKKLVLPSTLEYIGKESFMGCSGITELVIPDNVTSIYEGAFRQCDGLKSLSLPLGLVTIGVNAFSGCPFLTSVELPFTLKTLGKGAFENCTLLNTVKISKNTTVGANAFKACSDNLKFISVANNTRLNNYIKSSGIKASVEIVKDLSHGTVANIAGQEYTKSEVIPAVTITLTSGEKVVLGKDYKVVCRNNIEIGTAKAYIVGINSYGEGYVKQFKIVCKHKNVTKKVSKAATCTRTGNYIVTCNLCGNKTNEVIPATGHTGDGKWVIEKRPTISTTGSKYMLCKVCKARAKTEIIAKAYPDVNGDKLINSADALIVLRHAVGLASEINTDEKFMNADTNGDNKVNSMDALTILRIAVGLVRL